MYVYVCGGGGGGKLGLGQGGGQGYFMSEASVYLFKIFFGSCNSSYYLVYNLALDEPNLNAAYSSKPIAKINDDEV